MDLILWRHAEAEDSYPDLERELTRKGCRQAQKMASWLKGQLADDLELEFYASEAVRAQQTLVALSKDYRVDARLNSGCSAGHYLSIAGWPNNDANRCVVIVGHQPEIGQVASLLLFGREQNLVFRKGAIWWFSRRQHGASVECLLRTVLAPEQL